MVAPLERYKVRGMLWYQGESNVRNAERYEHRLKLFIRSIREIWGSELPLGLVQIAPYEPAIRTPDIWDAQRRASRELGAVGLITTYDVGNASDIHTRQKRPIADRLANWALSQVYSRQNGPYTGPLLEKVSQVDSSHRFSFAHAEGLAIERGQLILETSINGETYYPLRATIDSSRHQVVAQLPEGTCFIRFGWNAGGIPNLTNVHGLVASAFKTNNCKAKQ